MVKKKITRWLERTSGKGRTIKDVNNNDEKQRQQQTCCAFIAPFESCLLANTSKIASFSSSSSNIAMSSCLATPSRSESQESTTKMMASDGDDERMELRGLEVHCGEVMLFIVIYV